jgi:arylsulfatase A-like enzyme
LGALVVACLALGAFFAIWRPWGGAGGPTPDILIVTIDTLRSDASPADMPVLIGLADRGIRCLRARTVVPLTLPSHASLLTGIAPRGHGMRDNTAAPLPKRADRDFSTLAEEFRARGYDTAAFVASAVLDPRFGLGAGFDHYGAPPPPEPGQPRFATLDAEQQVARLRAWLDAHPAGGKPRFVWIHLWEPHEPYRPYDGDPAHPKRTTKNHPPEERYWGEVRRADKALGEILALFDAQRTISVVTSDHGEGLGEHGEKSHGFLTYGATMDIPLVFAGPGVPVGVRPEPASILDIAPTLRALCEMKALPGDGRSLLDVPTDRVVIGESLYGNRVHGWAQVSVASDERYSLVDAGPRIELFDREKDPRELSPIAEPSRHAAYERLDRALLAYQQGKAREVKKPERGPGSPGYSPYYGSYYGADYGGGYYGATPYGTVRRPVGKFLSRAENRALVDPVKALPADEKISRMRAAIAMRSGAVVERLLGLIEELERNYPDDPAPSLARGRALLLVLRRPQEAADALQEARRRGYRSVALQRLIAVAEAAAAEAAGDVPKALAILEKVDAAHPGDPRIEARIAELRKR